MFRSTRIKPSPTSTRIIQCLVSAFTLFILNCTPHTHTHTLPPALPGIRDKYRSQTYQRVNMTTKVRMSTCVGLLSYNYAHAHCNKYLLLFALFSPPLSFSLAQFLIFTLHSILLTDRTFSKLWKPRLPSTTMQVKNFESDNTYTLTLAHASSTLRSCIFQYIYIYVHSCI